MKKLIAVFLAVLCLLSACSSDGDKENGKDSASDVNSSNGDSSAVSGGSDKTADDSSKPNDSTPVDDDRITVFLPTAVYFSAERLENDGNFIEYDEFGNMSVFRSVGANYNKVNNSEIDYDDSGRPIRVKNYHRDVYIFSYADNGEVDKIEGSINYGNDSFLFERSSKEGCAYQLTLYYGKNYLVEQYDEEYRLVEQLYYKYEDTTAPFHRRYYTYDQNGNITKWEKAYDSRYDFTNTYTAADFDEMGHCLTQNKIKGVNGVWSEYVYAWTSIVEKDSAGRIIKDTHTCPDVEMTLTFEYKYDGDELVEYSYEIDDDKNNMFSIHVYSPVKVEAGELQLALMNIYSQYAYSNNMTSFYGITTDWSK